VVIKVNSGNHAKPLEWPESEEIARTTGRNNTLELKGFFRWKETGGLKGIYEWWIPGITNKTWRETPWYDGDTTVQNLRFWQRNGIKYLDYESQQEINNGFPLRWAQYYIGARAMWNPDIDPHQVLLEACHKLYGPAATMMTSFYELQQRAMHETPERVGNWSLPLPHLLYTPAIETQGDVLLTQAEKSLEYLPPEDKMRERVAIEYKIWQRLKEVNAIARQTWEGTYTVILDGQGMDFSQPKIDAATVLNLFGVADNTPLEVIDVDGQSRKALPNEAYDLQSGVTFRTQPKP
jgi:hypothetical protein